jgi:hypothetical protein
MKNSNNTIGNRTRDVPACSAVTQRVEQAADYFCDRHLIVFMILEMSTQLLSTQLFMVYINVCNVLA